MRIIGLQQSNNTSNSIIVAEAVSVSMAFKADVDD